MRKSSITQINDYFALKFDRNEPETTGGFSEEKFNAEMGNKSKIFVKKEDLREILQLYPTKEELRQELKVFATKEELVREISRLDIKISDTKADLSKEINKLKVDLHKEISTVVKWVVGFGITILIMFISLYLKK